MNRTFRLFAAALCAAVPFLLPAPAGAAQTATVDLGYGVRLEMVKTPDGLWFGKFEVTQEQWKRVTGTRVSGGRAVDEGEKKPVVGVSPRDVQGFLSRLNGLDAVRKSGLSFRLPTEREWLAACRAGGRGMWPLDASGREGSLDSMAWYRTRRRNTLDLADPVQPVGGKHPNAYGLYDMLGNAEEMTSTTESFYDPLRRGNVKGNVFCGGSTGFRPRPEPIDDNFVGPSDDGGLNFRNGCATRRVSDDALSQSGFRLCATGTYVVPGVGPRGDPGDSADGAPDDAPAGDSGGASNGGMDDQTLFAIGGIVAFVVILVFILVGLRKTSESDTAPGFPGPDPSKKTPEKADPEQGDASSDASAKAPSAPEPPEPAEKTDAPDAGVAEPTVPAAASVAASCTPPPRDEPEGRGPSDEPEVDSGVRAVSVTLVLLAVFVGIVLFANGVDKSVSWVHSDEFGGGHSSYDDLLAKWQMLLAGAFLCITAAGSLFPLLSFAAWKDCCRRCEKVRADMRAGRDRRSSERLAGSLRGWAVWWTFCGIVLLAVVALLLIDFGDSRSTFWVGGVFRGLEVSAVVHAAVAAFFFGLSLFSFLFAAVLRGRAREAERLEREWWMWAGARSVAGSSTPPPRGGGIGPERLSDPGA